MSACTSASAVAAAATAVADDGAADPLSSTNVADDRGRSSAVSSQPVC
jgi:hypothetical protein